MRESGICLQVVWFSPEHLATQNCVGRSPGFVNFAFFRVSASEGENSKSRDACQVARRPWVRTGRQRRADLEKLTSSQGGGLQGLVASV